MLLSAWRSADGRSPTTAPTSRSPTSAPAGGVATSRPASSAPDAAQVAQVGDTAVVHYTAKLQDGTVVEATRSGLPVRFMLGAGKVLRGLDRGVAGMKVGQTRTLTLLPEDAFGPRDERGVVVLPLAQFGRDAPTLRVGQRATVALPSGRRVPARIVRIDKDAVTLDANHELAGKTLVFEVELVELEKRKP